MEDSYYMKKIEKEFEREKDKERRYQTNKPKSYRESVRFAFRRILRLDYSDREEKVEAYKVVGKFLTKTFGGLALLSFAGRVAGFTGMFGFIGIVGLIYWLSMEAELEVRDRVKNEENDPKTFEAKVAEEEE